MNKFSEGFQEYTDLWAEVNDIDNPEDKIYMEHITDKMCYELQLEVRPQVDELMRIELEMLREAQKYQKWLEKHRGNAILFYIIHHRDVAPWDHFCQIQPISKGR